MILDQNVEHWQMVIVDKERLIKILGNKGKINLAVSTEQLYNDIGLFDLDGMMDIVGGEQGALHSPEKDPMAENQEMERLANLLGRYFDDIFFLLENRNHSPTPAVKRWPPNYFILQKRAIA
jgi:hypothetical protein